MARLFALAILAMTTGSAVAGQGAPLGGSALPPLPEIRRDMQVFIAPCGRPYRVPKGEPYPVAKWFAEADTNHDGRLTEPELRADALRFFAELDSNHDGLLSPTEVERYETDVAPEVRSSDYAFGGDERRPRRGGGGRHGGTGHGGGRMGGELTDGGAATQGGAGLIKASYSDQDYSAQSGQGESDDHPYNPIGSYVGSMGGAARFSLIARPEPVTAANVDMHIDIRPADFAAQAEADFEALDTAHKGYLLLTDLPETPVQRHRPFGRRG